MKDTRIQITQRLLKDSMLVLLKEKNIKHITVKQICDGCGLNRSTFYLHYTDVYDLYDHICNEFIDNTYQVLLPLIRIPFTGDLKNAYNAICDYYLQQKDILLTLMGENGDPQLIQKLYQKEKEDLHSVIHNYYDELKLLYNFSGSQSVLYDWIAYHPERSKEEVINLLIKINSQLLVYPKD